MNNAREPLPIWQPSPDQIKQANLTRFIEFVNKQCHLTITDYSQLYEWSIAHKADFWANLWQFCAIKHSQAYQHVVINAEQMSEAKWFVGAQLNFAENLLSRRDDKLALIYRDERQQRRSYSYKALYNEVAQLACAMRQLGIGVGDRISGYLPNLPETVIAMLATTSIGAIWSSCSPDFGLQSVVDRFGQIQPKLLFTVDGYYYHGKPHNILEKITQLAELIPSLEKIIIIPFLQQNSIIPNIKKTILYSNFLASSAPMPSSFQIDFTQLPFDHPIYIMYSSGTTGAPKCIVHGAGGTLLQHLKELILHTDLHSKDVITYYTTCGWMMWNWVVSSLAVGATLVLYEGSPAFPRYDYLFDLIDEEKINIFGTSAKFISSLEKNQVRPCNTHSLTSLRTILSTGSPLSPENFDFVYDAIKHDVALCSISGGTDIVSCFALGCPLLPIYRGELQCRGLGMDVAIFNEDGQAVIDQQGELVCRQPFPAQPIYFWNDPKGEKYHQAYFAKFPGVWAHGDYATLTNRGSMVIYGRSDAILNPGGVRIGTAEIYRQAEKIEEIMESIVIGQQWQNDIRIILFVKLRQGTTLDEALQQKIRHIIRSNTTARHVPSKIIQVQDIPRTFNGKIAELAVRNVIHHLPITNKEALANPETLAEYENLRELL